MFAAFLLPCLILLAAFTLPTASGAADERRPTAGVNNVWYFVENRADTVIVFVHGLGSDSRDAWYFEGEGKAEDAYWPGLVEDDPAFSGSAIFLGGYHTEVDSHDYDFRDAANQLHRSLAISVAPASSAVLDYPNILFVTHSAGGIVVRHMLTRHVDDFADKAVGLVLIASPSIGSRDADRFRFIAEMVRSKQGRQLTFNNPFLESLDKDFKNLVSEDRIPRLKGVEWLEHHLLFGTFGKIVGMARDEVLVDAQSGGRYFGEPHRMPGSDHVSIVKPDSRDHESHRALLYFYERSFKRVVAADDDMLAAGGDTAPEPTDETAEKAPGHNHGTAVDMASRARSGASSMPVRIDEKRSASFCDDHVRVEVSSVWKKGGGRADEVITVSSAALEGGKTKLSVGDVLPLGDGCTPTLVDTGRDEKYYAIFQ